MKLKSKPRKVAVESNRRSGKTAFMLNELVDAVKEGQPHSIVVFATMDQALDELMQMGDVFIREGLHVVRYGRTLGIEGSSVLFSSVGAYEADAKGWPGAGFFWDHHALEVDC